MAIYVQFVAPLIDRYYNFHGPQAFLNRLLSHSCKSGARPAPDFSNTPRGYFVQAIKIQIFAFGLFQTVGKKGEVGESCSMH